MLLQYQRYLSPSLSSLSSPINHILQGVRIYFQGVNSVPPFSSLLASGGAIALSIMSVYVSRFLVQDSISFLLTTIWLMIWLFDLVRLRTMLYLANLKSFDTLTLIDTTTRRNNIPIYFMIGLIFVEFGLICLLGIPLHSWSTIPKTPSLSPEQHASYLSRILFFWAWPLLRRGSKGQVYSPFHIASLYLTNPIQSSFHNHT